MKALAPRGETVRVGGRDTPAVPRAGDRRPRRGAGLAAHGAARTLREAFRDMRPWRARWRSRRRPGVAAPSTRRSPRSGRWRSTRSGTPASSCVRACPSTVRGTSPGPSGSPGGRRRPPSAPLSEILEPIELDPLTVADDSDFLDLVERSPTCRSRSGRACASSTEAPTGRHGGAGRAREPRRAWPRRSAAPPSSEACRARPAASVEPRHRTREGGDHRPTRPDHPGRTRAIRGHGGARPRREPLEPPASAPRPVRERARPRGHHLGVLRWLRTEAAEGGFASWACHPHPHDAGLGGHGIPSSSFQTRASHLQPRRCRPGSGRRRGPRDAWRSADRDRPGPSRRAPPRPCPSARRARQRQARLGEQSRRLVARAAWRPEASSAPGCRRAPAGVLGGEGARFSSSRRSRIASACRRAAAYATARFAARRACPVLRRSAVSSRMAFSAGPRHGHAVAAEPVTRRSRPWDRGPKGRGRLPPVPR